jgi:Flp pilus assembly protein TadB
VSQDRPEHQSIDGLAASLGRRADVEGLAKGVRIATRRQLAQWALRWGIAVIVAVVLGASVDWLVWLPVVTVILALVALGGILAARARAARRVNEARGNLDGLDGTLSELARDPRKDRP